MVRMNPMRLFIAAVVIAAIAAAGYWFWRQRDPPFLPPAPAKVEAPAAPQGPQPPKHPVPPSESKPLPPLGASDPSLLDAIGPIFGAQALDRFFNVEDLIRRFVATVDNLPRESVAMRLSPARPVGGLPTTQGRDASLVLAPENARRYAAHVRMLELADAKRLAAVYFHFYPLFQQAYADLGYPNAHFNDRLVEVIDHLLAAPEVKGPIRLTTPHVLHEFADPELESRSAGQKVLIRMGPENAARVKAKLRELRAQVARGPAS
jgi:hypothetical protein